MEKKKQQNNLLASGAFIIVSIVMVFYAIPNEIAVNDILGKSTTITNSRFFPYVVSIFIGIIALIEFIAALIKYMSLRKQEGDQDTEKEEAGITRALIIFGLIVLYALLFNYFGFIIATIVVPPIVLFVMGSRKWYHYASFYGVAAITYILFKFVLHISI